MKAVLPAHQFSAAWLNVALASGQDDATPALYRTVQVEFLDASTVRLIALDSYLLLRTVVADDPVDDGETTDDVVVAMDPDQRMKALMTFVHKASKDDPDAEVTLTVASAESPDRPTLDPGMDRQALVVEAGQERLMLDVFDGGMPDWRAIKPPTPSPASAVSGLMLNGELLARFGKFRNGIPHVRCQFNGALGVVGIEAPHLEPPVVGLLMPVRDGAQPE